MGQHQGYVYSLPGHAAHIHQACSWSALGSGFRNGLWHFAISKCNGLDVVAHSLTPIPGLMLIYRVVMFKPLHSLYRDAHRVR